MDVVTSDQNTYLMLDIRNIVSYPYSYYKKIEKKADSYLVQSLNYQLETGINLRA